VARSRFEAKSAKQVGVTAARPMDLTHEDFRFTAIRPGMSPVRLSLDGVVESVEWRDEGTEFNLNTIPALRGSITMHQAHPDSGGERIDLREGDRVRCELREGQGQWRPYWTMRVQRPQTTVEDGTITADLADDLILASRSEGDFHYRKTGSRKKRGWLAHEIIEGICSDWKIPAGLITRGTFRMEFNERGITPLEAIRQVVRREAKETGRKFLIRWMYVKSLGREGLCVLPMRRNPLMDVLESQIRTALITHGRIERIVTAAVGHGTLRRKSKSTTKPHKLKDVRYVDREAVKRFGYISKQIDVGKVDSQAQLRRRLIREVNERQKPYRSVENFSHAGIPDIRRGDAVQIRIPDEGFAGRSGIMFVTSIVQTLSAADYTMTLNLSFTDQLDPAKLKAQREKAERARKRRQKGKK
jgi:hypothetical protein